MKALGLIETMGLVGAVEACDAACKTSDVEIYNKHLITGGIVTVEFVGDIGSVNAAMEAAVSATKKMGVYIGSTIMARPDIEIFKMLDRSNKLKEKEEQKPIELTKPTEPKLEEKKKEKKIDEKKAPDLEEGIIKDSTKKQKIKKTKRS